VWLLTIALATIGAAVELRVCILLIRLVAAWVSALSWSKLASNRVLWVPLLLILNLVAQIVFLALFSSVVALFFSVLLLALFFALLVVCLSPHVLLHVLRGVAIGGVLLLLLLLLCLSSCLSLSFLLLRRQLFLLIDEVMHGDDWLLSRSGEEGDIKKI